MKNEKKLEDFDSKGARYEKAFKLFLANTDQKVRARGKLEELIGGLTRRDTLIDVGAGTGVFTQWLSDNFEQSIAIEPNSALTRDFKKNCPEVKLLTQNFEEVHLDPMGSLVLCSHVLYYLDQNRWTDIISKLSSWVAKDGMLVVILQNPGSDCMKMVKHFTGKSFDLPGKVKEFERASGDKFRVSIDTIPSKIETKTLSDATSVAEFIMNVVPPPFPTENQVSQYVEEKFKKGTSQYLFSCDQDFVIVRRK